MADSWDNHYTHRAEMEYKRRLEVDPALKKVLAAMLRISLKEDPELASLMRKAGPRTVMKVKLKLLEVVP